MTYPPIIAGDTLLTSGSFPAVGPAKVVLAGGCFDILHFGHVQYLTRAKEQGDVLVVAIENDAFIHNHKHRAPFHTQQQRAHILLALRCVDVIIMLPTMQSGSDYERLVAIVKPHVIAITKSDPHAHEKSSYASKVGGSCVVVTDVIEGLSSSSITTYGRIVHD